MTAPAIQTSCGWCHPERRQIGDSTSICPDCLNQHFPEVRLFPARAGKVRVPLPGVFESKEEMGKTISAIGVFYAVLLLIGFLSAEVLMAWVLP